LSSVTISARSSAHWSSSVIDGRASTPSGPCLRPSGLRAQHPPARSAVDPDGSSPAPGIGARSAGIPATCHCVAWRALSQLAKPVLECRQMMSVKSASNIMIVTGTPRIHIVHALAPLSPWTVVQQMRRHGVARAITRSGEARCARGWRGALSGFHPQEAQLDS
jgi:hypothetical protein